MPSIKGTETEKNLLKAFASVRMRAARALILSMLVSSFALTGCGGSSAVRECPESQAKGCLFGKICAPARGRNCQVCQCKSMEPDKDPKNDETGMPYVTQ